MELVGSPWEILMNLFFRVKTINSDLYAVGAFSTINGVSVHRAAKWNGTVWTDVNGFSADPTNCILRDIEIYNGNIYVCGNFVDMTLGINHLAVFKEGIWQNVEGGVLGFMADLQKFANYKNELYLIGAILKTEGNIGHGIQKWNDTIWSEVGASVQDMNDGYGYLDIRDIRVHQNELYVVGGMGYAGHVPAKLIAKWNGTKWCGLATKNVFDLNIHGPASSIDFYNDTLYFGIGNDTINGVFTNKLIKYLAGSYTDTCSINYTGINEISNFNSFSIYPNPAQTLINIEFENASSKNYTLSIVNVLGQTVYSKQTSDSKLQISVDEFPNGIYTVQVQSKKGMLSKKICERLN
jgi:hypothetical protein